MGERQSRYQQKRRERGLCGWGGCTSVTGKVYYCPIHAQHRAAIKAMRKAKQQAVAA